MSRYSMGVDVSPDGVMVTIAKTNDFVSKVIANGWIDDLIKAGKKYPVKLITVGGGIDPKTHRKLQRLINT